MTEHREKLVTNRVSEERKKEEDHLVTKLSNQDGLSDELLKEGWIRRSIAFPFRDKRLLDYLRDKARLDGYSFNGLVRYALAEYRERHPLPNPQAQIDRMLEVKMPLKPISQCCVLNCHRKTRWILRLQNRMGKCQEFQVCMDHKRWLHPDFRLLVSYRELR